jgi:nucleoside-diphosphate-sugar epimerase
MVTILGAGGAIGSELAKELTSRNEPIRLVSRNPKLVPGAAEAVAADLSNLEDTVAAVSGSRVAYLLVGLKYDISVWQALWPRIMRNAIEACKRANARLVFFDNVYMYGSGGRDDGANALPPLQQERRDPCADCHYASGRGEDGQPHGTHRALRRLLGPRASTGIPNVLVFDKLAKGAKASWLVNDSVKHSFTFTPDAARSLVLLADSESAWNQTWHVPTAPDPPTGKQFIELVAKEFGAQPKYRVLTRPMLWMAGWFDTTVRELYEMLYQYEADYIFDSTKFTKAFRFQPTFYPEGVRRTAQANRQ